MGRRSSCSLGDSESGYQASPCYSKTKLQLFLLQHPKLQRTTTVEMAVSKIRQNYHEGCEALINKQINMEFYASYVYLSMSSYFNRDDQAHGMKLMEYQTKRGGRVVFQDVAKPTTMDWGTPIEAMEAALELEKTVNQSLL